MNYASILELLQIRKNTGWTIIDLKKWNEESFYYWMIENSYCCLAWIAFNKNISSDSLERHHFKRNEHQWNICKSMPRLLIVTDGNQWYLSKFGSSKYVRIDFKELLENLILELSELKSVLLSEKVESGTPYLISETISSIKLFQKRKNRTFYNNIKGAQNKLELHNSIFIDRKVPGGLNFQRNAIKTENGTDLLIGNNWQNKMHFELKRRFSKRALQILYILSVPINTRIYVSFCNHCDVLIIKLMEVDFELNAENLFGKSSDFRILDQNGEIRIFESGEDGIISKNDLCFFKLDPKLIRLMMNN